MNRQLQLVGIWLRKDLQLFWLFALLNAALIVPSQFPPVVAQLGGLAGLLQFAILLSTILLTLAVFHEDAVVSSVHEWLTRPVRGGVVLLAKSAFVVLATILPAVLGAAAYGLYAGRSLGESVLTGVAIGAGGPALALNLLVMALAAITSNVRQAIIVLLGGIALLAALGATFTWLAGPDPGIGLSGSQWLIGRTVEIVLVLAAVAVLWVQYGTRRTRAARAIVGVAMVAGLGFTAAMSWPRVFSVQQLLSRDPAAAASIRLELAQGCFAARVLDADRRLVPGGLAQESLSEEQRRRAGPGAIFFSTQSIPRSVPTGYRLTAGRVQLTYRAAGRAVATLYPVQVVAAPFDGGLLASSQAWLLPRSTYDRLAKGGAVETDIDYSLSLLAPQVSAEFLADGRREFHPGLGYCAATFDPVGALVSVDCFKPGTQPAQLVASVVGTRETAGSPSGYPDFAPAALDFWGGQRHLMRLRTEGRATPRVRVTAFAALAHFDRRIEVPGVLGGSLSSCPAP